eukprot:jgi/Chlat1/7779/Chrsp66S07246
MGGKGDGEERRERRSRRRRRSDDDDGNNGSDKEEEASSSGSDSGEEVDTKRRSSGKKSSSRRRQKRADVESDDSSEDDDESSDEESKRRRRKKKKRRREERRKEKENGADKSKDQSKKLLDEEQMKRKAEKKAKKLAAKLKTTGVAGYTNDNNPFGDANLSERFVWRKKIERDIAGGADPSEFSAQAERRRMAERLEEVEKVKKRREERERERARHEEELAMLARERAVMEFGDWGRKEDDFHLQQQKTRSAIRLREGRAKPIDLMSKNLLLNEEFTVSLEEPFKVFIGLSIREMEELQKDIQLHLELDRATPLHVEFWENMMVVCENELRETRRRKALEQYRSQLKDPPPELLYEGGMLHASIDTDVQALLANKTFGELQQLQDQIQTQIRTGEAKEVEYWEAVLKRLAVHKSIAKLKDLHNHLLRLHLAQSQQRLQRQPLPVASPPRQPTPEPAAEQLVESPPAPEPDVVPESPPHAGQVAENGAFSPEPVEDFDNEEVVDAEDDLRELQQRRLEVLQGARLPVPTSAERAEEAEEQKRIRDSTKMMGQEEEGDAVFQGEVQIKSQGYWWHDKYRPRKPKYFNRVHTGYEWNKYNQTHYDHDNPPPKVVQGYKFNLFYPDLIDKTKTPTYYIEKDDPNGDTCIIRFHAGPPYEDIAFRIVNKEWEYSHKKGFKCTYERGILHLYFNFKRYRYRR